MIKSETSKYRYNLGKFCIGNGIDCGHGGDKVDHASIGIDNLKSVRVIPQDYTNLIGEAENLYWFNNNVLDYVYSSHLLEDFENTVDILREWLRVIKIDGHIVLLLPDQQRYEKIGTNLNTDHKIKDMSLKYMKDIFANNFTNMELVYSFDDLNEYNFAVVYKKIRSV